MYNSYYTFSSVCEGGLTNKLEMSDKHAHNDRY